MASNQRFGSYGQNSSDEHMVASNSKSCDNMDDEKVDSEASSVLEGVRGCSDKSKSGSTDEETNQEEKTRWPIEIDKQR